MEEEWRTIKGFPMYEVSNLGRVRSWNMQGGRHDGGKRARKPHLMTLGRLADGTRTVTVRNRIYRGTMRVVHRIVLDAFVGECPEGHIVHFEDGDKSNCHRDNLSWVAGKMLLAGRPDHVRKPATEKPQRALKPQVDPTWRTIYAEEDIRLHPILKTEVLMMDGCMVRPPVQSPLRVALERYHRRRGEVLARHHGRQIPEGYEVGHTCGTKACLHPEHLRLQSRKENMEELAARLGDRPRRFDVWATHERWASGEELPAVIRKPRKPRTEGASLADIAAMFAERS